MPTPKRPSKLSKTYVKNLSHPGRYGDGRGGHGLSLRVRRTLNGRLSKTWSQRIRVNGRLTNLRGGPGPKAPWPFVRLRLWRLCRNTGAPDRLGTLHSQRSKKAGYPSVARCGFRPTGPPDRVSNCVSAGPASPAHIRFKTVVTDPFPTEKGLRLPLGPSGNGTGNWRPYDAHSCSKPTIYTSARWTFIVPLCVKARPGSVADIQTYVLL